jgi:uncharacterized protein
MQRWLSVRRGVAALALGLLACATYSDKTADVRAALSRGDYDASLKALDRYLKVRSPEDLPNKWRKDDALAVLERATILQAMGNHELSARDFEVADKQLELLDIARDGAGKIGKYIYSDSATKYRTSPTEKLSLNAMNMCNYLVRGDLQGAKIEAKRFTVMRNYIRDYDPGKEHGAFGSYVAGFVYERLGQADEALRYYDEALMERDFGNLREPIARLAQRGSYRGERIKDYLPAPGQGPAPAPAKSEPAEAEPAKTEPGDVAPAKSEPAGSEPARAEPAKPEIQRPTAQTPPSATLGSLPARAASDAVWLAAAPPPAPTGGEVLVIAKTGRVPWKEPRRIPIGAAIGLAGAFVTGDTTLLEYGMFKVVTYPELVSAENSFVDASLRIDGRVVDLEEATDLGSEIVAEYDALRPKIIGAALTRMIARAAVAEGARAAGNQAEGQGALIGFLAAAAAEATLVALDKPDTRSWSTLPERVFIGRQIVPAGQHTIEVEVSGPAGGQRHTTEVEVTAGGFAVVDVTTLR